MFRARATPVVVVAVAVVVILLGGCAADNSPGHRASAGEFTISARTGCGSTGKTVTHDDVGDEVAGFDDYLFHDGRVRIGFTMEFYKIGGKPSGQSFNAELAGTDTDAGPYMSARCLRLESTTVQGLHADFPTTPRIVDTATGDRYPVVTVFVGSDIPVNGRSSLKGVRWTADR